MKNIIIAILFFGLFVATVKSQSNEFKIGDKAPEISLPNLKGEIIKLSSLKNKLVLIDFWASWCSPCVNEQPILADLYKKFRNSEFTVGSGFEIYGVSFDIKKKQWQNVIKKYKIDWIQVSDLKYWSSPVAKDYNLQELPYNLLIDGDGKIIAKNLHGEELNNTINKLVSNNK
jgi:peroxiredoxin